MTLFDDLFYSSSMLAVFSDENRLQRMLDFESALASAEANLGLIPSAAARIITQSCSVEALDLQQLRYGASLAGNLAIPLVKQLTLVAAAKSAEAAGFVHWGATSQDVIDTGFVLQVREAISLLDEHIVTLNSALASLAQREAETLMPGRTWLQQAVPITFGFKVAGWLDAILRHQIRLRQTKERALTLQFGGAVGTLASLGANGMAVQQKLADTLGVVSPDISWHSSRDRFSEIATTLGLIAGTLGKIARDVSLMTQTEVAEVFEGAEEGRGGSSTMPHKRNPVACSTVLAAAVRVPGLVATTLCSMITEHERGLGNWQTEWDTIPQIFNLCAGALERTVEIITGLEVDSIKMAANLETTKGLVMAEAVSMALSPHIGRSGAHAMVERACRMAIEQNRHLRNVLQEDAAFCNLLPPSQIEQLFDPSHYLGITGKSIDRVLARASAAGIETQHKFIDLEDVRIHYQWLGAPEKPVLVLSHSLGADLSMWDAQIEELSKHFRILRYDTRGHGRSSATAGPYTLDQLGRDVITILDILGVESCNFCGLSLGGMIGQWLGLHAPSRITKLVLCNTGAKIGDADIWNTRIAAVESGQLQSIVPVILSRWFTHAWIESHPQAIAPIRKTLENTDPKGYAACCSALRDADLRGEVQNIRLPVLVISGTYDPATPPSDGEYLASNIDGAQLVELNASHLSNVESPKEFNAQLLKFLFS